MCARNVDYESVVIREIWFVEREFIWKYFVSRFIIDCIIFNVIKIVHILQRDPVI